MTRLNRFSAIPYCYASLDDLQCALLVQVRRFNRACSETAAGPITLSDGGSGKSPLKVSKKSNVSMERLELLRAQVKLLKNMSAQLLTNFGTDPKAKSLRQQVDSLVEDIVVRTNELQKGMSNEARGKINANVVRTTNALIRELQTDLSLSEDQIASQYFIGEIAPPNSSQAQIAAELAYIRLSRITGPDGYAHRNIIISVAFPDSYLDEVGGPALHDTTRSGNAKNHIYVSVSPEFKVPRKIRWDAQVNKPIELRKMVRSLLERDNIIGTSVDRDIPVPTENIQFAHNNIKSTEVKGNVIEVKVKNPKMIYQTERDLREQLIGIVQANNPKDRSLIRTKIMRDSGTVRFIFSLPAKLKGRIVSNEGLSKIKNILNLNDEEIRRVRTALEDHEE